MYDDGLVFGLLKSKYKKLEKIILKLINKEELTEEEKEIVKKIK